jgi:hypothetical protein
MVVPNGTLFNSDVRYACPCASEFRLEIMSCWHAFSQSLPPFPFHYSVYHYSTQAKSMDVECIVATATS